MALDTSTDVEQIIRVQDDQGDKEPPTNLTVQKAIRDLLDNYAGLDGFVYTTSGTTEEQLPSNPVPGGVDVLVTYRVGNTDTVFVGPSGVTEYPLSGAGDYFSASVDNTDDIWVRALSSGDEVAVIYEVTA